MRPISNERLRFSPAFAYNPNMPASPEISYSIRSFEPRDQQVCHRLYSEGLIGGKIADNDTGLDIDDIQSVYMEFPGNGFWVAESEAQIVGMVAVQHYDEGVGEIRRLRVANSHRRRGIGSALLEQALLFCQEKEYSKVTLDTFMDREPAMRLFEKFRFRHDHTRNLGGKDLLYFYLDLYAGPTRPHH
jgi:ribosomal protein S18 acetylase RimI-like enzyme